MICISDFLKQQFSLWPEVARRHLEAAQASTRTVKTGKWEIILQHNPARIQSTGANISAEAVAKRPCFLCENNRPPQQVQIRHGRYSILVNPFPVFHGHLTIASVAHQPQRFAPAMADLLEFSRLLPGHTLFYNGPKCGASAPDHLHFQGVPSLRLPLLSLIPHRQGVEIPEAPVGIISLTHTDPAYICTQISAITELLPPARPETPLNILCTFGSAFGWQVILIPRKAHRPSCYPSRMISPASIDLAGVFITPQLVDFNEISPDEISAILNEVTFRPDHLRACLKNVIS